MNPDELKDAILHHTVLILAGTQGEERRYALQSRYHQLTGMLELARNLQLDTSFIAFLEQQRNRLRAQIEAE